jgi:hypothetical protein
VLFDQGAFSINPADYALIGMAGRLTVVEGHSIDAAHLAYHHEHYSRAVH